jgi:hypothetical protein
MGLELRADLHEPGAARLAVVGPGADLDQLVRLQGAVDLGDDGFGEALVADEDDGAQLVGLGAQRAAAIGREWGGHGRIIGVR